MEALRVQQAAELVRDTEWTQLQLRRPQDSLAALLWRLSSSPTWPQSLCPSVPGCAGMDGAGETVDDSLNALEAWNAVASASMNAAGVEQARRLLGRVLCSSAHEASEAERDLERCVAFQAFAMVRTRADAGSLHWMHGAAAGTWARSQLSGLTVRDPPCCGPCPPSRPRTRHRRSQNPGWSSCAGQTGRGATRTAARARREPCSESRTGSRGRASPSSCAGTRALS